MYPLPLHDNEKPLTPQYRQMGQLGDLIEPREVLSARMSGMYVPKFVVQGLASVRDGDGLSQIKRTGQPEYRATTPNVKNGPLSEGDPH